MFSTGIKAISPTESQAAPREAGPLVAEDGRFSHRPVKRSRVGKKQLKVQFDPETKSTVGRIDTNPPPITNSLEFMTKELGLYGSPPEHYAELFRERLDELNHPEDLLILLVWGKERDISFEQQTECEIKVAKGLCSDILYLAPMYYGENFIALPLARALLNICVRKGESHFSPNGQVKIRELQNMIQECLAPERVQILLKHMPYSGFARYYNLLLTLGIKDEERLTFIQEMMQQSLQVKDLLAQLVRDLEQNPLEEALLSARISQAEINCRCVTTKPDIPDEEAPLPPEEQDHQVTPDTLPREPAKTADTEQGYDSDDSLYG